MGNHIHLTLMTKSVLDQLFTLIETRKNELPEGSYTSSLFSHERGENAVLEKIGEEATELILAAKDNNHQEIIHEAADVVYHLLVLLSMKGVHLNDLLLELQSREK
jgi:phosphoribosyl-ATP pyrophosphohydrolase